MCGIAGIVARDAIDVRALERATRALAHRGPDGEGFLLHAGGGERLAMTRSVDPSAAAARVGLGHRRLSIIDLRSDNDQPFTDPDGRVAVAFNGEIYNYVELRRELESAGHHFRTEGDTEELLQAYLAWGADFVKRLVGMWAFALVDRKRRTVLLSRDRLGVKPLYYAEAAGRLTFASEIKALEAAGVDLGEPRAAAVARYLTSGITDDDERTFFTAVNALPAGANATVPLDGAQPRLVVDRYWELPRGEAAPIRPREAVEQLRAALTEAVRLHARADVTVGTCLSGGIDSSGIIGLAEHLRARGEIPAYGHQAFGYVAESSRWSEERYMAVVAESNSLDMTYVRPREEEQEQAALTAIAQQDEPFGSASIVAQWFVFQAARDAGVKVMLDGQGADEVFAGYHHFLGLEAARILRQGRAPAYGAFARSHRRLYGHPPLPPRTAARDLLAGWLSRHDGAHADPIPDGPLLSPALRAASRPLDRRVVTPATLGDALAAQTERVSLPSLLRFEDRNSMAHSIEARVPYLDHRVVELGFALPDALKLRGAQPKWVLREALRPVLPREVLERRDKIGFRADPGLTHRLAASRRAELLEQESRYEREWLDAGEVARLLDATTEGDGDEAGLWRMLNIKLWLRRHWS